MSDIVYTIGSRNYLAQAKTLMASLGAADPTVRRVLVVSDGAPADLVDDGALAGVEIRDGDVFCTVLPEMAAYYTAIELNTAIKPYVLGALLREPGVRTVTYLDPDIVTYRALDEVRDALRTAQIALTPHLSRPLPGPHSPNDHVILRSGVYNLGFIAVRAGPQAEAFADWWSERCRFDCRVAFEEGLFTDQRWVDLAPGFFDSIALLRAPTFNLAYWSLPGHELRRGAEGWTVDGEPLVFFHFSGFDPARPDLLSKHQDRIQVAPGSALADMLQDYADRMIANGHGRWSAEPYGFERFADQRLVTPLMRRALLRAARSGQSPGLGADSSETLDAVEPTWAVDDLPQVTRLMAQLWSELPGAEVRFPRDTAAGRLAFHAFFAATKDSGVDARARRAADQLTRPEQDTLAASHGQTKPPRLAVATAGDTHTVARWFRSEAPGEIAPRAVAAAWRADPRLRRMFPGDRLGDLDLLARCAGSEAIAGRFDPSLLPPSAWDRLTTAPAARVCAAAGAASLNPFWEKGDAAELYRAFGLAVAAHWPDSVRQGLQAPWIAPGALQAPWRLPRLLDAPLRDRPDLQRAFDVRRLSDRLRYLNWFAKVGVVEYGLEPRGLPARLRRHPVVLASHIGRGPPEPIRQPPSSRRDRVALVLVGAEAELARLPTAPLDALVLDRRTGAWRDQKGAVTAAPGACARAVYAGGPDGWAANAMALHLAGVETGHAAGWIDAKALESLDKRDWALGVVDEILTPTATTVALDHPSLRRVDHL